MKPAFFVFLLFTITLPIQAQPESWAHPELQWYTLRTEHFDIHYHDRKDQTSFIHGSGPKRTAILVGKIAEEIYEPVTAMYGHKPERIHFIIRDTDDYSNGGAYYYDNKVEIWASSMDFELRGTHNWLRNVVTHEFTHMVSLQAMMKFSRKVPAFYMQYIGYEKERRKDVLRGFPNVIASYPFAGTILPIWFAEGVAQYQQKSLDYEFWDSHRDMILRSRILSGEMLTISQMSTFGKNSIGNESSYNHGYAFVSYLASKYGERVLHDICRNSQTITNSFERAFRKAVGRSVDAEYREWLQQIRSVYENKTESIRQNLSEGKPLYAEGTGNFFPAVSPDGRYITVLSNRGYDYLSQTSLCIIDRSTNREIKRIKKVDGSASWSPDGRWLMYSKNLHANPHNSQVNDIYIYDLPNKKEHRITRTLRAASPSFSPDGRSIVTVVNDDGTTNLFLVGNLPESLSEIDKNFNDSLCIRAGLELTRLTHFKNGEQVYKPVFHPSGKKILFDISQHDGRDIAEMDMDSRVISYLIRSHHDSRSPVYDQDGQWIYFSSDRTGIFNIYRYNPVSQSTELLTNVTGGAFYPSVNAGQIHYTLYKDQSFRIHVIDSVHAIDPGLGDYHVFNPNYKTPVDEHSDSTLVNAYYPKRWPLNEKSYDDRDPGEPDNALKYKTTFLDFMFMPVLRWDYGKPKPGIYLYSGDVLSKSSFFAGAFVNYPDFDRDLFGIFEYGGFGPTVYLEVYNVTRGKTFRDNADPSNDNEPGGVKFESIQKNIFELREVDIGADFSLFAPRDTRLNFAHSEYFVKISGKEFRDGIYQPILQSGGIKYFYGNDFSLQWKFNNVPHGVDHEINPRKGRKWLTKYSYNMDNLVSGFAFNPSNGTLETLFKKGYHHRIETTWNEYLPVPFTQNHTLEIETQAGLIPTKVDSFYNFFGGGLIGLRGYSFYSIEGSRLALVKTTYRFPIWRNIDRKFLMLYLDKIYGGLYFGAGNAWSDKTTWKQINRFRKDVGFEVRMEFFSFYVYPTRLTFDAVYGLDRFNSEGGMITKEQNGLLVKTPQLVRNGKEWRFYLTVLFGFTLFD